MAKLSKEEREALKEQLSKEAAALDAKKTKKRTFILDIPQEDKEEQVVLEEKQEEDNEWDVKIGDPIEYFDPELSYELTGYRPITKDKGLDFNPDDFTEMARTYEETGEYTSLIPGTVMFADLCYRELDRCMNGLTVGKYHITGDNYFWLNYYRMKSVVGIKGAATGRNETFPTFIAKQYEYFHYMELAAKLKKDVVAFKSRGVKYCTPQW